MASELKYAESEDVARDTGDLSELAPLMDDLKS